MTTTPRLDLPPVSVRDAHHISQQIEEAAAGLDRVLAEVRTLLQQRDLIALWDQEAGTFIEEFLPIAARFHDLQRARLELSHGDFTAADDLSTWVEAQR